MHVSTKTFTKFWALLDKDGTCPSMTDSLTSHEKEENVCSGKECSFCFEHVFFYMSTKQRVVKLTALTPLNDREMHWTKVAFRACKNDKEGEV